MMTTTSETFAFDVLICGAGAAGLTLAIDLARRGVSFWLIEKMNEPFRGSRGKAIHPRTLEIFEDLGFVDKIAAAGGPYPPQREYQDDGSYAESAVMESGESTPDEPYRVSLMVAQFHTEGVMRARLHELGHAPEFGRELVGIDQDDTGVTARVAGVRGEETVRVRYLVGADGGRSFVRQAIGVSFPGKTLGVRAVVADLTLTGLDRDAWHRFARGPRENSMSLCPLIGTELFQLQAPVPLEGEIDLSAAGLNNMIAARCGRDDICIEAVSWASVFSPNARLAERYRVGRVLIAGDAAHTHPPTGGQGLNTSVQDAYNLGWKLAAVAGGAPDALLDTYEEERRPIAASMLGLATQLLDAIKRGELRRGREVQQLDLSYPESSLAFEKPTRNGGLLAGDRAPDAPLLGAGGQFRRLFDLLQGPHWTLLCHDPLGVTVAPRQGLHIHRIGAPGQNTEFVDAEGHFRHGYGLASNECVLVRPDGYVGAIVASRDLASLEAYQRVVGLASGSEVQGL